MNDLAFVCDRLEKLFPLDIMFVSDDLKISGGGGHNPICRARGLAAELIAGARVQELPFLYMDEFQVCYGAMRRPGGYVLFGPMSTGQLSGAFIRTRSFWRRMILRGRKRRRRLARMESGRRMRKGFITPTARSACFWTR